MNPLDFIINTTIEKLQGKLLLTLRNEIRKGTLVEGSTDKQGSPFGSHSRYENSSSISVGKKKSEDVQTLDRPKSKEMLNHERGHSTGKSIQGNLFLCMNWFNSKNYSEATHFKDKI